MWLYYCTDAIRCQRCNAVYGDGMQQSTDSISQYLPEPEAKGASSQTVVARYQMIYPRHGEINIKATMTAYEAFKGHVNPI